MGRKPIVKEPTPIQGISVDLGNAYSNMLADNGVEADWRSIIGRVSNSNRMKQLPFDWTIGYDDGWFVFGELARTWASNNIEDFPTKDRYTSQWYNRLFIGALHKAYGARLGDGVFYPRVVASVPASEFAISRQVERIKSNLAGEYAIATIKDTYLNVVVDPDALTIVPEGAGSFYSMLKSNSCDVTRGTWFTLDLGYLTGDILAFRDAEYMSDKAASDDSVGVRVIAAEIANLVRSEDGPALDPSEYDKFIGNDNVEVSGKTYRIKEVRDKVATDVGERIGRFLRKAASGQNVSGVLLTGGGANFFKSYIKSSIPVTIAENPRRANVIGAFQMITE